MYKLCVKKIKIYQFKILQPSFYTCEAMHRRKHLREHDQKATLSSDIERSRNKARNFKN